MADAVYALPDTGVQSTNIGWISYDQAAVPIAGGSPVQITNTLVNAGSGYEVTFELSLQSTSGNVGIKYVQVPLANKNSPFGRTAYIFDPEPTTDNIAIFQEGVAPTSDGVTLTITLNDIEVTKNGMPITDYAIVAVDPEQTNLNESFGIVTNGGEWQLIENMPPVQLANTQYIVNGQGSNNVSITGVLPEITTGGTQFGNVPAGVFLSISPTTIQAILKARFGGQGVAFGVIVFENEPQYSIKYNCFISNR